MDWNDYQRWVGTRARPGRTNISLLNAALGLAGEAGEVADIVKKVVFHKHPITDRLRIEAAKELGDILFYLTWAAGLLGFSLSTIMEMNKAKLDARYPNGFEPERSINRVEGDVH